MKAIDELKQLNRAAGDYVARIDPTKWARAYFPMRRFGHVTSNISESMNRWLEEARFMDPVNMFSEYILKINRLFEERRSEWAALGPNKLPKDVEELLQTSIKQGGKLHVDQHTKNVFAVKRQTAPGIFRVVDLEEKTCTCGFFREYGVPCRHFCAAVVTAKGFPQHFVVPERRLESLRATYVGFITPVDTSFLEDDHMKAPEVPKKRGRPRVKRIPSALERGPKERRTYVCGICHQTGHNSRTCPNQKATDS